jgi:hypothetical protein
MQLVSPARIREMNSRRRYAENVAKVSHGGALMRGRCPDVLEVSAAEVPELGRIAHSDALPWVSGTPRTHCVRVCRGPATSGLGRAVTAS